MDDLAQGLSTHSIARHHDRSPRTVGIVGGGYAGMAAAVTLASRGVGVVVYEAARSLGGRARAVDHRGVLLDNGQHLLIGAYRDTLALLDQVGTRESGLLRLPLAWHVSPDFSLRTADLPAPWHLAVGLMRARGIGFGARVRCVRFLAWCRHRGYALPQDMTVATMLQQQRQDPGVVRYLWEPLCVAALNTPCEQASARVFLAVLRDGLAADRAASDLLLPCVDLTSLFPAPAARYVAERGGEIRTGANVATIHPRADGYAVTTRDEAIEHAAVIVATQPYRVPALIGHLPALSSTIARIEALRYQPIVTVYLHYASAPRLPHPMTGLAATLTQWVFDRAQLGGQPGMIAAVISASGRHQDLSHAELATRVHAEIAAAFPGLGQPLWSQVIEEKRATFECAPDLRRPDQETAAPGLYLAGDYTLDEYPATIEAAVRSGLRAARLACARVQSESRPVSP